MAEEKLKNERLVRGIAKGAGVVFIGLVVSRIFGYAIRAVIGRYYGPEGYGYISTILAIFTLLSTVSLLGFTSSLPRQISFYLNKDKQDAVKGLISSGFYISSILGVIFGSLLILFSKQIALYYFHDSALIPFIRYFGAGVTFYLWIQLSSNAFRGFKNMLLYSLIKYVGRKGLVLLFLIIAIIISIPVKDLGAIYLISYILLGCIGTYSLFRSRPLKSLIASFSKKEIYALFQFSWPLMVSSIIYIFLFKVDILMIGYFKAQSDVGIYNSAVPIGEMLSIVLLSFTPFLLPAMTENYASEDFKSLDDVYSISTKWIFLLTIPLFSLIFFFSEFFLIVIFGKQFLEANTVLKIISIGFLFSASVGPIGNLLVVTGRTRMHLLNNLIIFIVNVILNYYLIQSYGILGGAIATAISYLLLNGIQVLEIYLILGIQPFSKLFIRILLPAVGLAFVMSKFYSPENIVFGILSFLIYGLLYLISLKVLKCFDDNDRIIFREFEKKYQMSLDWLYDFIR